MSPDRNITLLVVEDDQPSCDVVVSMLAMALPNARILCADNGIHALQCFNEQQPDLVITDISMPQADGIFFMHKLQELTFPADRLIVITAHTDRTKLDAISAVATNVAIVFKPLDFAQLHHAVLNRIGG